MRQAVAILAMALVMAFAVAGQTFVHASEPAGAALTPVAVDISPAEITVVTGKTVPFKATVYADVAKTVKISNAKVTFSLAAGENSTAKMIGKGVYSGSKKPTVDAVTVTVNGTQLTATAIVTVNGAFTGGKFIGSATSGSGGGEIRLGISATKSSLKGMAMEIGRASVYDQGMDIFNGTIDKSGHLKAVINKGGGKTITILGDLEYDDAMMPTLISGTWSDNVSGETGTWQVQQDLAAGAGPKIGTYNVKNEKGKTKVGQVGVIVYTDPATQNVRYTVMALGADKDLQGNPLPFGMADDELWVPNAIAFHLHKDAGPSDDTGIDVWGNGTYVKKRASGFIYSDAAMTLLMGKWATNDM